MKAVLNVCQELNLNIPVIGLAKNDQHQTEKIITSKFQELAFPQQGRIKNFLTSLQEEIHQYVINFHRKLHRRTILKTKNLI